MPREMGPQHARPYIVHTTYQGYDPMTSYSRIQRWTACLIAAMTMTVALGGCSAVPRRYVWMAESDTTLSSLIANPEKYQGKVVLLGGVIMDEKEVGSDLWLYVKNRPLDQEYKPRRPVDTDGPDAGYYWIMVGKQQLPRQYQQWGRITVAGRVLASQGSKNEPVLALLYVRGWGVSVENGGIWENVNPNYVPSVPGNFAR